MVGLIFKIRQVPLAGEAAAASSGFFHGHLLDDRFLAF